MNSRTGDLASHAALYNPDGTLQVARGHYGLHHLIFECSARCPCPPTCSNRVVQHGIRAALVRGWFVLVSLFAVCFRGLFAAPLQGLNMSKPTEVVFIFLYQHPRRNCWW